jgi:PKD repeat protein
MIKFYNLKFRFQLLTSITALLLVALLNTNILAQGLTGVKTIDPSGSGANNFLTLKAAIDTLNSKGVGAGGVTFNVTAGISETASSGGFAITATGTATAPIIFAKSGLGSNPQFLSYTGGVGTNSTAVQDGIIKLIGSDYVTIDGLDFIENAANTTNPATMEYGIALYKASVTNGCQYNTIKNCNVKLNRINNATASGPMFNGSVGILVINSIPTAATTAVVPTSVAGSNSFNKIYANTIDNCNIGIGLNGYSTTSPFTFCDYGNDIGGNAENTGNTILNFGGGGATNISSGIQLQNNYDFNIGYNKINNNDGSGVNHGNAALRGIFCNASGTSSSGTVKFNKVTVKSAGTTTAVYGIDVNAGSTAASNTINVTNNIVENCEALSATSLTFYGIGAGSSPTTMNISNNTVRNIEYSTTSLTGTGTVYGIFSSGATTNLIVNGNTINNINLYGTTGGTVYGISSTLGTNQTVTNDTIYNININGTGTSGGIYGINTSTGIIAVNNNIIYNLLNNKTTGTGLIYGISNTSSPTNENFNNNTIYNLTHSGTGLIRGLNFSTVAGVRTIAGNKIYGFSTTSNSVEGMYLITSTPTIRGNRIYDLTANGATGTVSGINLNTANTTANIINNFISDLKAPAATGTTDVVRGINLTTTSSSLDINVFNNTVLLTASSSGANFSSTSLFHTTSTTATTARLILRNNILINKSTPSGTGIASAFRRSSTSLTNFSSLSNKNIFYAGVPSATTPIFYDGTNADQTLANYKTRVGAVIDKYSMTEDVTFVNSSNDLHIAAGTTSVAESNADLLSQVSIDIDGQTRPGPTGSSNGGGISTPDIGADEYDGFPQTPFGDIYAPGFSVDSIVPALNTCLSQPHIFYAKIIDASAIDTAQILWSLGRIGAQTPINFTQISGNRYQASIPSNLDSLISYSFKIVDGSINKNRTLALGGTYTDLKYVIQASINNTTVNLGSTVQLTAAQSLNVQLGTATTTHSTSSTTGVPYPTYYGNGRQQYLLLASELNALGIQAGQIKSVGFFITALGSGAGATLNGYTIKLAQTTASNLSSGFNAASPTVVFGPLNYTPILGQNNHSFASPFTWDGTSNVIIDICFSNQITGGTSFQSIARTTSTTFVSSASYYADGTTGSGACTASFSATASTRPNIYINASRTISNATWSATANAGLVITTGGTVTAVPTAAGNYTYNVSGTNGTCSSNSSVNLTVLTPQVPVANFNASSSVATVGSTVSTILLTDLSTNLPTSWKWSVIPNNFSYVAGTSDISQNPQIQFNSTGVYTVKLVCKNIAGADSITKSALINVTASYCTTSLHSSASTCIDSVIFGSMINASISTCALPSYGLQTAKANIMRLAPTKLRVKTAASGSVAVWIDLNQNGIFETLEYTSIYSSSTSAEKTLIIPSTAKLGETIMRVRSRSVSIANTEACSSFSSGETEDYIITIVPTVGDFYAPNFASSSTINPPGGACSPTQHTISIGISDTTGIDSAFIIWSVNNVARTRLPMTNNAGIFSGTIPAQAQGATVAYSFLAIDSSPQKNTATQTGSSYVDAVFNVKANTSNDSIGLGGTVQLGIVNPPINIGTGTTSNSTTSNLGAAYPAYYGNGRQQYLILASELTALGVGASNLTSLAFDVTRVGTGTGAPLTNYTINLGTTTAASLVSSFNTAALTTVFTAASYTPILGSNRHTFSTPFAWDGVSNIIVDICFSNNISGTSTFQHTNKLHTTTFPSTVYYQVDGTTTGICAQTSVSASGSTRPNMVFTNSSPIGVSYTWSVGAGGNLSATNIANPTATASAPGIYFYKVNANNGQCTVTDSVRVKVIIVAKPTAAFTNLSTTILTSSSVQFTDNSTNLPNNWKWSFTPNTVNFLNSTSSTSKNPIVEFTAAGVYSVKLVVRNNIGADSITKSNIISVVASACTANLHSSSSTCLTNITLNTLASSGSSCALPSYSLKTETTTLVKLTPYPLSVTTSASAITSVWIDYNQNGNLEVSEWQQVFTTGTTGTINISVPLNAKSGLTLMRIRSRSSGSGNAGGDACSNFFSGETQDFMIRINNPIGDYYPPNISNIIISPNASSCIAVARTITAKVIDTTGVDTVRLFYSVNAGAIQKVLMTSIGSNNYSATIPPAASAAVSYAIYAIDNSAQRNFDTSDYSSYRDEILKTKFTLGPDVQIGVGSSVNLQVQFPSVIGTGTTAYPTSNASNIFDRFYGGRKTQYLYTASELSAVGISAGPINSIAFFANAPQLTPTSFNDFTVEMKMITATSLSGGTFETGGATVYGPNNLTPSVVNGKINIPFTSPFVWDGTSSILVSVCWSNNDAGNTTTSANQSVFLNYTTTTTNTVVYRRTDTAPSSTVCAYTTTATNTANRANIEFGVAAANYTFSWSQASNGGLSATTIANPIATPTGGVGSYQYIVTVNDGTCAASDTINVALVAAPIVDLGPNGSICGTTPRILDAGNAGATFAWTFNGTAFGTTQTVSAANAGTYKVKVTNASGISVIDSIVLTAAPAFTISINNQQLCAGGNITVNPGTYSSYLWSTGATTSTLQISTFGTYSVNVTNASGCAATASFQVIQGTSPIVNLGQNQTICKSNPISLNAGNPGSTYLWSTGASTQSITVGAAGTYIVKVTSPSGCFAYDTVVISNFDAPLVNLGVDKQECAGIAVLLDAGNPGATYLWSTGATTQSISVTTPGIFIVSVTNTNGCISNDTIVITRYAVVNVNLGTDRSICSNDTITLDAGNPGAIYNWTTGETSQTIKVNAVGTYGVAVTNSQGCIGLDEIVVTHKLTPNSDFTYQRNGLTNVQFNANVGLGNTYAWNFGDPTSSSNVSALSNPIHEFTSKGSFIVTLTVTNISSGCVTSTKKDIGDVWSAIALTKSNPFNFEVYPNPISNSSMIKYNVLKENSDVSIEVYNLLGEKVYSIINNVTQGFGTYEFEIGELLNKNNAAMLFIQLNINGKAVTQKVILHN